MNNIYKQILVLGVLIIIVAGCGGSSTKKIQSIEQRHLTIAKLPQRNAIDNEAYNYFINGSIFETIGEYQLANSQYEKALQIYPQSDEIRKAYANTFIMLNDFRNALEQGKKVKQRDLDTWLILADCYAVFGHVDSLVDAYLNIVTFDTLNVEAYYRLGLYYKENNNLDSAIWAFDNLSRISATPPVYLQLGNFQILAGRYDDAERSYLNALALDSSEENIRSYLGLAAIYENRGDMEKSISNLAMAAKLAPGDMQIQNRLLQFYQIQDRRYEAIKQARIIDATAPNDFGIKHQLAVMLYDVDSLETADSLFNYMLSEGDSSAVNYYYLGRINMRGEKYDLAETYFDLLTQKADSIVDGWLNLGLVYRLTDRPEKEIAIYETAMGYMNNMEDSLAIRFSKAVAYERSNQFEPAVEEFEKIIEISPNNGQALNYLGYMLADKGVRLDTAKAMIEGALALSPDNGAYLDSYGWVLFKLGETQKALEQLLLAYERIKNDPVVTEHIGDVYEALNNRPKAVEFWNKALELDPENEIIKGKLNQ